MSKKIYDLMDWAAIEEIVYGEAMHPENLLGAHNVNRNTLVQCFFPGAKSVTLITDDGENIKMEKHDEAGFFATLLPGKDRKDYKYHVSGNEKSERPKDYYEVYTGETLLKENELDLIMSGSDLELYKKLGSHVMTVGGRKGVRFSVWAPNARRVSVVGDFNEWNGLTHQMIKDERTGIYSIFIPGLKSGEKYKYEILISGTEKILKPDPYAFLTDGSEENASIVSDKFSFKWNDADYMKNRVKTDLTSSAFNLYEINPETVKEGTGLKNAAKSIIAHMKNYGYTHADVMPVLTYVGANPYVPSSVYAISSKVGGADELAFFVNALHEEGLGVILQYPIGSFDQGKGGISFFDGTCLYEHQDFRKGVDPRTGAKIYRYGDPVVDEYILSNASYLKETFHIDGFKFTDVSSMLYLDYYRGDNEWLPNIYGGNENLESINFIKRINRVLHDDDGFVTIAEEKSGWPFISDIKGMSEKDKSECLLFDFVMNNGFNEDVLSYMVNDPIERFRHHDELTMASVYQYRENYISYISHENVGENINSLLNMMPGTDEEKKANLRAMYGYILTMPGKKEIFMGQDTIFDIDGEEKAENKEFAAYMKDLLKLVGTRKALSVYDFDSKGFDWINNFSANENVIVYTRQGVKPEDTLTIIVNFANVARNRYHIGVPAYGKYREVFSSDDKKYGGEGRGNDRILPARKKECDARDDSISLTLPPLSITILSYTPFTKAELETMEKQRQAREKAMAERNKKRELFIAEKKKIREELYAELEKRMAEAEKKYR